MARGAHLLSRLDIDVHSFEHRKINVFGIRERPRRKGKLWDDAPKSIPEISKGMQPKWNGLGPSEGARGREKVEEAD
jgi:hypothetical protein